MNGLYKRVLKGAYPPIDRAFSSSLSKVLATMLRVDANLRPSSKQLLEMDFVRSKCDELGISLDDEPGAAASRNNQESRQAASPQDVEEL